MFLIMTFAAICIAIGYFPVTREIVITGRRARIFGVLLFLLCGPALALIDYLLISVTSPAIRASLGVQVLRWVLFGALVFASARAFYAKTHATGIPGRQDPSDFARRHGANAGGAASATAAPLPTERAAREPRTYDLE